MQKASLQKAVKMTEKSESTLRRDVKKGKVSADPGRTQDICGLTYQSCNAPMAN